MKWMRGKCNGYTYLCLSYSPVHKALSGGEWPPAADALDIIKQNPKVCSGFLVTAGACRLFFKAFPLRGLPGTFKRWTGLDRAMKNWLISWRLRHHNVSVPRPHALIMGGKTSWYVCAAMEGTISLQSAIQETDMVDENVAILCMRAIKQLARMHDAGVTHGDFKWGNLLVMPKGDIVITDLDSARRRLITGRVAMASDLARFLVSGMEAGLNPAWAHSMILHYAAERGMNATDMTARISSRVSQISRGHQRKYGRKSVCLYSRNRE